MKKLALLLGSLAIAATSFAGGKEVVPVEVVVKEVIREVPVYRNNWNGGYLEMYYKWWGKSTTHEHDRYYYTNDGIDVETTYDKDLKTISGLKRIKDRRSNGNRGRLHIAGLVNLTERQSVYFRVRNNQTISNNGIAVYGANTDNAGNPFLENVGYKNSSESTQIRIRYSYKHDFASLNAISRVHFQTEDGANGDPAGAAIGRNNLEYQFRMNFADYMFDNDFIKTTKFVVAPKVGYSWDNSSTGHYYTYAKYNAATLAYYSREIGGGHASTPYFGLDFEIDHKLP